MPLTLIPEDGTGLPNANSYATTAEATDYFASRAFSDTWINADAVTQTEVLIWATDALDDHCRWLGVPVKPCLKDGLDPSTTPFQALRWPRVGCPSRDPYSSAIWPPGLLGTSVITYQGQMLVAPTVVPPWLKKAVFLLGRSLIKSDRLADADQANVTSIAVRDRSRTFDVAQRRRWAILTPEVRGIVDSYRVTDAYVVRG